MARVKRYESKAKVSTIKATSRGAVKIKDNYFTVEYAEERTIPEVDGLDIATEREILWNDVNTVIDNQIADILKTFGQK